ncbi:MAG: DUF4960 domain-containing protein [Muribaculaceae bacterium]|nr:DUF4960 domain-containing protein [Muribaculaceae bacterium]
MKKIYKYMLVLPALVFGLSSCHDDNTTINIEGDTKIEAITISGQQGLVDNMAHSVVVEMPVATDLTSLTVDDIRLSDGASCDYPKGTVFNGSMPRSIHVTNGDVSTDYSLSVAHDRVEFYSFTVNGLYSGTIDNTTHTISVFVPLTTDLTEMSVTYEVNAGTEVTPAQGSLVDFSEPVEFTASHRTAEVVYVVTVSKNDMSQEPKAFVGFASTVEGLGDESKAACRWMMENVPNSTFVPLQDVLDGKVKLDDYVMVWAHFDFTEDWPSVLWDSRELFSGYWQRGGSILASRDGARYINDVWCIALDQQSPNNRFGGEGYEPLGSDLGFTITGHEDHPLYTDLEAEDGRILLKGAGCSYSNRTLQWCVDWEPYFDMAGWETKTGAKALASGNEYNANQVTIAEFEPREVVKGMTSGKVLVVGTPAFEWHDPSNSENPYQDNLIQFTNNAINYLCQ